MKDGYSLTNQGLKLTWLMKGDNRLTREELTLSIYVFCKIFGPACTDQVHCIGSRHGKYILDSKNLQN